MRIIIIDDNKTNLLMLSYLIKQVDGSEVVPFADAAEALTYVGRAGCDLLLVDFLMPSIDGTEVIRRLRASAATADVPAIMITSEADRTIRKAAIEAGATDFLTKPVDPFEIKTRVRNLLSLRRSALADRSRSEDLARLVKEATSTVARREREMVLRLARAIEARDGGTGAHVDRIAETSRATGRSLGLSALELDELYLAAPMHDIGKIAVADAILQKPGPLTPDERLEMQRHTVQGYAMLADSEVHVLQRAAEIALCHHERIDGTGYPHGLKADAIPIAARIVAVADVFDALTSERPYKAAWSDDRATDYLVTNSGTQFDPVCVTAFLDSRAQAGVHEVAA